jgi:hypothetical protein
VVWSQIWSHLPSGGKRAHFSSASRIRGPAKLAAWEGSYAPEILDAIAGLEGAANVFLQPVASSAHMLSWLHLAFAMGAEVESYKVRAVTPLTVHVQDALLPPWMQSLG